MKKTPIKTVINGKAKLIVYVEYQDGNPHSVITTDTDLKGLDYWDFDFNLNWDDYMHYRSGGGGSIKSVGGPNYIKGTKRCGLWVADCVRFNKYKPKNVRILKSPRRLSKDGQTMIDPFKFSYQEVCDIIYCKFCNGRYDQNGCSEHMNLGENKYNDGSELDE